MSKKSLLVAWLLAATAIWGCGPKAPTEAAPEEHAAEKAPAEEGVKLRADALKTAGVKTEAVRTQEFQAGLDVPGAVSIPSNARAMVTPPVAGKVVRLMVDVGDRVVRGAPLAEIQSGELAQASSSIASAETQALEAEATVRQQQAALELARGRLRTALSNLARQRRFVQAGAFSQPTLTAARNELNEAQTEQASAQSELAGAKSRLDRAERLSKDGLVSGADLDQARLDVRQGEIRLERAGQRQRLAQQTFDRESRIGQQGLLNAREIQTAEAETRSAKLEADQAQVALQGARGALLGARRAVLNAKEASSALRGGGAGGGSSITLTAPISGVVVEREATLGQAVERSSDLFDIENATTVWVTANVPQTSVSKLRAGVPVRVTTSAYPGRTFSGVVQLIGTRLDAKSRTLPVQCRVENAQGLLRAGLFTQVHIATDGKTSALSVPSSALVGEEEARAVFVEDGGKFERRKVRVGRKDGGFVEILEGLKVGERIATQGVFVLESESKKDELKGDED